MVTIVLHIMLNVPWLKSALVKFVCNFVSIIYPLATWAITWNKIQISWIFPQSMWCGSRAPLSSLRAESAWAVPGRRCPHSGVGEDFLVRRPGPLMKMGVTREQNVQKSIWRCQIEDIAEGYKRAINEIRGIFEPKSEFWVKKNIQFSMDTMF